MAKKKLPTLNPLTENPTKKTQLTKDFMLAYIKAKGTEKDKHWFKELVKECTIEKENKLKGKNIVKGLDMKTMRNEFAERFFPNLLIKTSSFFDEVEKL